MAARRAAGLALAVGLALVAALLAPAARAHDGPHRGAALEGTIVSLAGDVLTVKTEKAEVPVTLAKDVHVFVGNDEAERKVLTPGAKVRLHGSKLPGGGFAAREVTVELQAPAKAGGG